MPTVAAAVPASFVAIYRSFLLIFLVFLLVFPDEVTSKGGDGGSHRGEEGHEKSKPRFILHPGPHKTATSSIQAVLDKDFSKLQNMNWEPVSFSMDRRHGKGVDHDFAIPYKELSCGNETFLAPFRKYFAETALQGHHAIMSAEELDDFDTCRVSQLASMLKDFDVTIVIMYRSWLTHTLSFYHQLMKVTSGFFALTFEDYFMHSNRFDEASHNGKMNYDILIQTYKEGFRMAGVNASVVIIDYYGALHSSESASLMKIFFCDVVGIPCGPESFATETVANKNSDDIDKQAEVRHLFLQYAKSVGCNYPVADVKAAIDEVYPEPFPRPSTAEAMATYTKVWHELDRLPYMTLPDQSTILQEFTFSRDKDFREKYGDMILYGNATANRVETMNVRLDEADKVYMLLNPQWRTAFDNILSEGDVLKKCSAKKTL